MRIEEYFSGVNAKKRILAVLLVLTLITVALVYRGVPETALAPADTASMIDVSQVASQPVMPKGYQPNLTLRDPFAIPPEYRTPTPAGPAVNIGPTQPKETLPVVTGIVMTNSAGSAIIQYGSDSRSYRLGDFVGPYQIVSINARLVVLQGPSGRLILSLGR